MVTSTPKVTVAAGNKAQLDAWNGDEGKFWAEHYEMLDRGVAYYTSRLLHAAGLQPHWRVLDVGCGTGQVTRLAAKAVPEGMALGVDLSGPQLEVARRLAAAEGVSNAQFLQVDAQVHPFAPGGFDAVLSRTGTMFFADPVLAFSNLARALRADGQLSMITWQPLAANPWLTEISGALSGGAGLPAPPPDAPSPFALSDPARVEQVLLSAGFFAPTLEPLAAPMWFGDTADEAAPVVTRLFAWLLRNQDEEVRRRRVEELKRRMIQHQTAEGVRFESAAWLVSARR